MISVFVHVWSIAEVSASPIHRVSLKAGMRIDTRGFIRLDATSPGTDQCPGNDTFLAHARTACPSVLPTTPAIALLSVAIDTSARHAPPSRNRIDRYSQ